MLAHPDVVAAFAGGLRDGALPPGVTAPNPEESALRFAVYRNNVAQSLTEALGRRFPVIQRLVGEDFFGALARAFLLSHPPASPVLLAWGNAFPGFLEGFPPVQGLPYLPDVARIEVARGLAFHAADHDPLPPAALTRAAQDPGLTRLRLHPSARWVPSDWAIVSIWHSNQPGTEAWPLRADRPETALIFRDRGFDVPVHAIGPGDAAFLQRLRDAAPLLACAEAGSRAEPGHDPAPLLGLLAQAGGFIASNTEDQP